MTGFHHGRKQHHAPGIASNQQISAALVEQVDRVLRRQAKLFETLKPALWPAPGESPEAVAGLDTVELPYDASDSRKHEAGRSKSVQEIHL
jgi:hypothetical protein